MEKARGRHDLYCRNAEMRIRELKKGDAKQFARLTRNFMSEYCDFLGKRDDFVRKSRAGFKKDCLRIARKSMNPLPKEKVLVLEDNGRLVGYVDMEYRQWYFPSVLEKIGIIQILFVEKPYRSKGWGRKLLARAYAWLKKKGVRGVQLETGVMNARQIKFYER